MPKPTTCTCTNPSGFLWFLAPCNEDGWHCDTCRGKAPGEPPGYRPDLDVSHLEVKVEGILMDLEMGDFLYVSNSSEGDYLVRSVVGSIERQGTYDQGSIIKAIFAKDSDGAFWKGRGDAIRSGADKRERCECGKLATSFTVQGGGNPAIGRCQDHRPEFPTAEPRDPSEPEPMDPWEAYGLWEAKWLEDHPDDDRDSLELIEEYGRVSTEELTKFFDGVEAIRAKGGVAQ